MRQLTFRRRHHHILGDEMRGRPRVFFYEPMAEIALDVKKVLLNEGFHPIGFESPGELMNAAMQQPPQLFYICVASPHGAEIIQGIRLQEQLADRFVLAGGIKKKHEIAGYEAGANVYIPKPYMWRILPFMVRTMLFIDTLRDTAENIEEANDINLRLFTDERTIAEIMF